MKVAVHCNGFHGFRAAERFAAREDMPQNLLDAVVGRAETQVGNQLDVLDVDIEKFVVVLREDVDASNAAVPPSAPRERGQQRTVTPKALYKTAGSRRGR